MVHEHGCTRVLPAPSHAAHLIAPATGPVHRSAGPSASCGLVRPPQPSQRSLKKLSLGWESSSTSRRLASLIWSTGRTLTQCLRSPTTAQALGMSQTWTTRLFGMPRDGTTSMTTQLRQRQRRWGARIVGGLMTVPTSVQGSSGPSLLWSYRGRRRLPRPIQEAGRRLQQSPPARAHAWQPGHHQSQLPSVPSKSSCVSSPSSTASRRHQMQRSQPTARG